MALGFAVSNRHNANSSSSGGRIFVELMRELNGGTTTPPSWWLDRQKITSDGPAYGLVCVVRDVSDPREMSKYQADAFTDELASMLSEGWRVADPSALEKLGLDEQGKLRK
jgi:hypothetical protein